MQWPASCGGCRWATGKVRLAVCSVCLTIHIFRVDTWQPRIALLTPYTGANLGLKVIRRIVQVLTRIPREVCHSIAGYRFLRTQHLVIVCGGGQLNEEWGGAWQDPFALFKWVLVAKLARVPQLRDDKSIIPELLGHLDDRLKQRLVGQFHIPRIETWRDLVATLRNVDSLIASRLYSTILGL